VINELTLLKLNSGNASTKQKIIRLLSETWPLSAKEIHEKLAKSYSSEISYQAAHKTIQEMLSENIVEKNQNGYALSLEWIQKSKKNLEQVEKRYLENKQIKIPKEFTGTIEIEFDNYTTLCVSTAELLLSRQLANDNADKSFICTLEYGWFPFKLDFRHFMILEKTMVANPGSMNIIRKKTLFGEWVRNQYNLIKAKSAPIGTEIDLENDIFIQGNHIIEVKFSDDSKKLIEEYYKKWKNLEDCFKEFGLGPEPKIHATMRITKNTEMARFLRKQMEKVFEGKE